VVAPFLLRSPMLRAASLLALQLLLLSLPRATSFHAGAHYAPAIERSIQTWELPTLREQVRQHHVRKVAFRESQHSVVVLDMNGLQREVEIFPEVVPYLIDDLRASRVDFFVAPPPQQFPAIILALARATIATMLVIAFMDVLGLLGLVVFAWTVIFEMLGLWAVAVGEGWELTLADARKAIFGADDDEAEPEPPQSGPEQAQSDAIPVRVETTAESEHERLADK